MHLEYPAWVIGEVVLLDSTGHLLHEATQDMESKRLYLIHRNKHRRLPKQGDRNMAQMKEQIKTLEKDANKMEISNLSDAEFKTLFIRTLKKLRTSAA